MNFQETLLHTFSDHSGPIYGLANCGADCFLTAASDRYVVLWNAKTKAQEGFAVRTEEAALCALSTNNNQIIWIGTIAGHLHIVDRTQKTELKKLKLHEKGIFHLVYNAQENHVYTFGGDGFMHVLDADTFDLLRSFELCAEKIRKGSYSPDRKLLAVACGDFTIRIFDTEFYNELYSFEAHTDAVNAVAFHPTLPLLVSGGKDAYLNSWDVENGFAPLHKIPAHNFAIYALEFSLDGKMLASVSRDKMIKIWDGTLPKNPLRIDIKKGGHTRSVNDVKWLENNILCSVGDDAKIKVFEIEKR